MQDRGRVQAGQDGGDGGPLWDAQREEVEVSEQAVEIELHVSVGQERLGPSTQFRGKALCSHEFHETVVLNVVKESLDVNR